MNDQLIHEAPGATSTQIRSTLATMARDIGQLSSASLEGGAAQQRLLDSLARLEKVLALGPEPELRECPTCHRLGMRAATLCGYCWTSLEPPAREPR
jgi:hypothetical protein